VLTSSDICTTLEDLRDIPPGFFDAEPADDEVALLHTVVVEETLLRKNLLPLEPVEWPALKDGPLEGRITTKVVIDRNGKVRELGSILSRFERDGWKGDWVDAVLAVLAERCSSSSRVADHDAFQDGATGRSRGVR